MTLYIIPFVPLPSEGTPAYDLHMATYLIGLVIAIPFAIYALRKMRQKRDSISNWIPWKAKVLELEFMNGDLDPQHWRMRVRYKYEFEGTEYVGKTATFMDIEEHPDWHLTDGDTTSYFPEEYDHMRAAQKADEYFQIWINPNQPNQSVITNAQFRGQEWFAYIMIAIALATIYFIFTYAKW